MSGGYVCVGSDSVHITVTCIIHRHHLVFLENKADHQTISVCFCEWVLTLTELPHGSVFAWVRGVLTYSISGGGSIYLVSELGEY